MTDPPPRADGPAATSCRASAAVAAGAYGMRWSLGSRPTSPMSSTARNSSSPRRSRTRSTAASCAWAFTLRPPHFDVHQSGTIFNLGSQGVMFDNLIRRDPRDGGTTIIPDLAHSWEIAKDGKTYTFHLRQGVQFHDGAELTVGGRQGDVRPHRQAAARRQHPAQHPVQVGQRDHCARQIHRAVHAGRAAPSQLHHVGDRQRLERHRPQEDLGGQQLQSAQGRDLSRHRPVQERQARRERKLDDGEEQELLEQGTARISTASSSITLCRSRRRWGRRSSPTGSITCASPIR